MAFFLCFLAFGRSLAASARDATAMANQSGSLTVIGVAAP
jgi:hypothetical protein